MRREVRRNGQDAGAVGIEDRQGPAVRRCRRAGEARPLGQAQALGAESVDVAGIHRRCPGHRPIAHPVDPSAQPEPAEEGIGKGCRRRVERQRQGEKGRNAEPLRDVNGPERLGVEDHQVRPDRLRRLPLLLHRSPHDRPGRADQLEDVAAAFEGGLARLRLHELEDPVVHAGIVDSVGFDERAKALGRADRHPVPGRLQPFAQRDEGLDIALRAQRVDQDVHCSTARFMRLWDDEVTPTPTTGEW